MASNPFEAMLTPELLSQQREAKFQQEYANADPYVKMAAEAGFRMRENARKRGKMLEPEDVKARRNKDVMTEAQTKYADMIKAGAMDPDEAQAAVLEDAIRSFSTAGDWEQALALTQPLTVLKTQALERRKLKAEAINIESKPDAKAIDQQIAEMKAQQAYEAKLAALDLAEQRAQTAAERAAAQNALNALQGEFLQWKMQNGGGKDGKGNESVAKYKVRRELNTGVAAAAETASLMADLREQIASNPGAATLAGPVASKIAGYKEGAKALIAGNGYDPDMTKEGVKVDRWIKDNVADAKQQSLVVSLAYSFARANDPGGRLSNQDLEMAMKVVSGSGGPQARIEVIDQAFANLARKTQREMLVGEDNDVLVGENTRNIWASAAKRYGKLTKAEQARADAAGAAPAAAGAKPKMTYEEWVAAGRPKQ